MDSNGDGRIQTGANSPEYTFAKDESVVFHVHGRDVSIGSADLARKRFSVREHGAGSNRRISLSTGSVVPEFAFRDMEGNDRRLSDFRGKHVLLDFWGSWCGPCVRMLPEFLQVHRTFQSRGFVLVGLPSHERDGTAVRSLIKTHGITFVQAEPDSVKEL